MKTATTPSMRSNGWRLGLATLVVAVAGVAYTSAQAQPGSGPGAGMAMHGGPGAGWGDGMGFGGAYGPHMRERMLDAAGATAEQKTRIRDIFGALATDMRSRAEAGHALHRQLGQQLLGPTIDAGAVESVRQQMLAQHDAASKRVMQAMLDAAAVLTPEQRAKLAQHVQQRREMFERHRHERRMLDKQSG